MLTDNTKPITPSSAPETKSGSLFWPVMFSVLAGLFLALVVLPSWLPSLVNSMTGSEPKVFWYLSRSTAVVAFLLMWLSMAMGLTMTGKLAQKWPGMARVFELHQFISILGLGLALVHGLLLMGDKYIAFSLGQVLAPFTAANYYPFWVGLGQTAFYVWGIVVLAYYLRRKTGRKVWRSIHYTTYGVFLLVLVHGLTSGTDAGSDWAFYLYWMSAAVLLFLTVYRILFSRIGLEKKPQTVRE